MRILAIDPGNELSAYVFRTDSAFKAGIVPNAELLQLLDILAGTQVDHLAIEMIASYGMPVGQTVFETCFWVGRFVERCKLPYSFVYRKNVMLHLCNSPRGNDATVRRALLDSFGGDEKMVVGTKAKPGVLYGFKKDMWAALAVHQYAKDLGGTPQMTWITPT